jgi:hypothetical protein
VPRRRSGERFALVETQAHAGGKAEFDIGRRLGLGRPAERGPVEGERAPQVSDSEDDQRQARRGRRPTVAVVDGITGQRPGDDASGPDDGHGRELPPTARS